MQLANLIGPYNILDKPKKYNLVHQTISWWEVCYMYMWVKAYCTCLINVH